MAGKMKKGKPTEVAITGFVEEIELDDGEMGLQIDDGERVYQIVMDKIGSKLERYIDEEVDVTGLATHTDKGRELKVNTFRLTEGVYYDDDEYDEENDGYNDDENDRLSY
ncbi:hypothetical protein [uncultured Desulfosarcina sp.]|uniref:hypothetical protein n=1 Tax=uncultured Desulfosarcina sp. TaxID=218289 RepID=UPI0029C74DF8|nr:hypothetical protein [uncultured Desulfosarcina sp.]